jgi:exodeoxyribonuclease V beta subunit
MQTLDVSRLPLAGLQLIEASAGTGKTHAITSLYLRLLLETELAVADILVVTFTRAATEELRGRIRRRLVEALRLLEEPATLATEEDESLARIVTRALAGASAATRRLRSAIAAIDEAAIYTIHGFCQRALRDHAFESGQTFTAELTESQEALVAQAVADWWRRTFYADAELAGFAASRSRLASPGAVRDWLEDLLTRHVEQVRVPAVDREALGRDAGLLRRGWLAERTAVLAAIAANPDLSRKKDRSMHGDFVAAAEVLDRWCDAGSGLAPPGDCEALTQRGIDDRVTAAKRGKGVLGPQLSLAQALGSHLGALDALELNLLRDALRDCREALDRTKRAANVMAFDDLVRRLYEALQAPGGRRLAAALAARYRVALIDEFQDTDPLQFGIFDRVYRGREGSALLMIGDPKQAIYSFRGADVHAYVRAKHDTPPSGRHTLGVNWRSTSGLVKAVNALFGRLADPFLFAPDIVHAPVRAAGRADRERLVVAGVEPAPLQFWLPADGPPLGAGAYREASARAVASHCAELLGQARAGAVTLGNRSLRPRDVAVLVRTGREAQLMQAALREVGIGSALTSRDDVFQSEVAADLRDVLDAVIDPRDERRVRRALCSPVWGIVAAELDAQMVDEAAWDGRLAALEAYRRSWVSSGFMPMFRHWLHLEGIAPRLLARPDGERALTNLLHLAELLQQAERERATPEALRQWLTDAITGRADVGEEKELRLESDENLVQIVTQHKSKGLEYPVVFLPFVALGAGGKDAAPLYHDPSAGDRLVLDYLDPERAAAAAAQRERLAEDLRLLYVSLTRATHLCIVCSGALKPKDDRYPALAHLLHAQDGEPREAAEAAYRALRDQGQPAIRRHLEGIAARCPHAIAVVSLPEVGQRLEPAPADTTRFAARAVRREVTDDWAVTSYTELARLSGEPAATVRPAIAEAEVTAPRTIGTFPRGRRAGVCFHGVLEDLDFEARDAGALRALAQAHLRRNGLDEAWAEVLAAAVDDVLDTPLADGLRLRELDATRRRSEVGFCYPIDHFSGAGLLSAVPSLHPVDVATPRFTFAPRSGLMKGFVDLVFEHRGRYYLADWKTNWLGPQASDYDGARIAAEMRRHHYDLQYCVYAVALHRYLAARIADYDYERHAGGVYYFFVRGMSPATGMERGVYFERPPAATVQALDALLRGEAP